MANIIKPEIPNRILFVDDEDNVLKSLKRVFVDEDYEVLTASSGKDGLNILNKNEVSVIISDQRMPEMDGATFLEKTIELSPNSIRIMLTGYSDINDAIKAINKGGANRYITKPWNDDDLVLAVRECNDRYNLVKRNKYLAELTRKQKEELEQWSALLEERVKKQTADIQKTNKELTISNRRLGENFNALIKTLSDLLGYRNKEQISHSRNVANLSHQVAKDLGLSIEEVAVINVAALLHDIGKLIAPDQLLSKPPEELNAEEFEQYKHHPIRGQLIIDPIEDLRKVGLIIRHHHEFYNGKGFPDRLKGQDIPIGARIISMADFIDRSIKKIKAPQAVGLSLYDMKEELGQRFDPSLYPLFEEPVKRLYASLSKTYVEIEKLVEKKRDIIKFVVDGESVKSIPFYEYQPDELETGMVLADELRSGSGVLLLAKGKVLTQININSIKRVYIIDPPKRGVLVVKEV